MHCHPSQLSLHVASDAPSSVTSPCVAVLEVERGEHTKADASRGIPHASPHPLVQVLINIRAAPINPGDLYTVHMGGAGSADTISKPPFIAGNDGVGVVVKVGPGVKNLSENDWVFPFKFGLGTWRSLVVWKEKDLLKMPVRSPCRLSPPASS